MRQINKVAASLDSKSIKIIGETTGVYEAVVDEVRLDLDPVKKVVKDDLCSIKVSDLVRRGDKLYKMVQVERK